MVLKAILFRFLRVSLSDLLYIFNTLSSSGQIPLSHCETVNTKAPRARACKAQCGRTSLTRHCVSPNDSCNFPLFHRGTRSARQPKNSECGTCKRVASRGRRFSHPTEGYNSLEVGSRFSKIGYWEGVVRSISRCMYCNRLDALLPLPPCSLVQTA